ncbi:MAG: aldehyde dehydrogenase [Alistipes sp.]|nr:aldehyde dehydrogenase [Alistipes sp.]
MSGINPARRREKIIDAMVSLGATLAALESLPHGRRAVETACIENPWFTPAEIYRAAGAISTGMLQRAGLERWAACYPLAPAPRSVAVIMAGNIPMAGFFDLLCVVASGHRCLVKYSSKDRVAMEFILGELEMTHPGFPACQMEEDTPADAVIASGSDNAIRHLKSRFGPLPALYRGNRASAAILTAGQTPSQMEALARDIFTYSGLGCRNVSHLLVPQDYNMQALARALSCIPSPEINPKYLNNFRQRRAVLEISGETYIAGTHFILRESDDFPASISEITFHRYACPEDITGWVYGKEGSIQCIVAEGEPSSLIPFSAVPFGRAQSPTLYDFPDRIDTMKFLAALP